MSFINIVELLKVMQTRGVIIKYYRRDIKTWDRVIMTQAVPQCTVSRADCEQAANEGKLCGYSWDRQVMMMITCDDILDWQVNGE